MIFGWILQFLLIIKCTIGYKTISDEDFELLPPLFKMDNYSECEQNKGSYCYVDIQINSHDMTSDLSQLIELSKQEVFLYDREEIHRLICLPANKMRNPKLRKEFTKTLVANEIKSFSTDLIPVITNITCPFKSTAAIGDYVTEFTLYIYVIFVITTTCYHILINGSEAPSDKKIWIQFSMLKNYHSLFKENNNADYMRLRSMQGFRTLTCLLICTVHTIISYLISFIENTKYTEDVFYHFYFAFFTLGFFLVQIFFLMSAWLLALEVCNIIDNNHKFTMKDVMLIFLNRIIRLWPALVILHLAHSNESVSNMLRTPSHFFLGVTMKACKQKWWYMLFFVQNLYAPENWCHIGTWYLSADVHLYGLSLLILYASFKFKTKIVLVLSLLASYLLFSIIIYSKDLDIIMKTYIDYFRSNRIIHNPDVNLLYTMTHVNASTYIVGLGFGIFYHKIKNKTNPYEKLLSSNLALFTWMTVFIGLPTIAVIIAMEKFEGIQAALIGPLLKPMFAFGVGIGILGMSMGIGGMIKRALESRWVEFLSKFTYTTYLYSLSFTLLRCLWVEQPIKISNSAIMMSVVYDAFVGFFIGFLAHLIVELPFSNLQRMYIPKVSKLKDKTN